MRFSQMSTLREGDRVTYTSEGEWNGITGTVLYAQTWGVQTNVMVKADEEFEKTIADASRRKDGTIWVGRESLDKINPDAGWAAKYDELDARLKVLEQANRPDPVWAGKLDPVTVNKD